MTTQEFIEYCKAIALESALAPSEEATWRYICRQYSQKFYTPLHEVFKLDPELVLVNVFEQGLDDRDVEEEIEVILEDIYRLQDPNYEVNNAEYLKQVDERILREEEERQAKINKNKKPAPKTDDKPKGGFLDLSYLEKIDQEK